MIMQDGDVVKDDEAFEKWKQVNHLAAMHRFEDCRGLCIWESGHVLCMVINMGFMNSQAYPLVGRCKQICCS